MSQLHTATPVLAPTDHLGAVAARLRNGTTALLRPLEQGEEEPLVRVFDAMSPESRALRYLTGMSHLPSSMRSLLADVDGERHVAWLATLDGEPAGIARYVRLPGCPTTAELAFEVADRSHGLGLGTVLLDAITTVASTRGVRRVQGTMAPENSASRHLLGRVGAVARVVDGFLEAEGPLRLLEPAVVDRSAVVRLACASTSGKALRIG